MLTISEKESGYWATPTKMMRGLASKGDIEKFLRKSGERTDTIFK
ncbi:hypothetical protein LEP1GSC185_3962 [Leptospira licerasiae serovar Varillal str. VAR 010]|nr:hypothetical protein LEP1GSC185_3962 [Leptospira licerasiae serovar Varillal str. VAR 010]